MAVQLFFCALFCIVFTTTTSYVQISSITRLKQYSNNDITILKQSEITDNNPVTNLNNNINSIINTIKSTPQKISDITKKYQDKAAEISTNIQAAPGIITEKTNVIINTIQSTPGKISEKTNEIIDTIQATPDKISNNIKIVTDKVIYLPANITATVVETKSNIDEKIDNISKVLISLSPLPFLKSAYSFGENIYYTIKDVKDGKITRENIFNNFKKPVIPVNPKSFKNSNNVEVQVEVKGIQVKDRNQEEYYEEVKETLYSSLDGVKG